MGFRGSHSIALKILLVSAFLVAALVLLIPYPSAASHSLTLSNPCALDPNNLFYNGTFAPGYSTSYGLIADGWSPFVFSGTPPTFNVVDNEKIDPHWSQQIYGSIVFDAGVRQTLSSLQVGTNYWYRLGYALAAQSNGGPNYRVNTIGRQVGVDPWGGTDVHSTRIQWGVVFWDGNPAVNIPALTMVFTARATTATIYFRAIATDGSGPENRVWFDAACGEPRNDLPASTLVPGPVPSGTRSFFPLMYR